MQKITFPFIVFLLRFNKRICRRQCIEIHRIEKKE